MGKVDISLPRVFQLEANWVQLSLKACLFRASPALSGKGDLFGENESANCYVLFTCECLRAEGWVRCASVWGGGKRAGAGPWARRGGGRRETPDCLPIAWMMV